MSGAHAPARSARGLVAGMALGLASGWNIANLGAVASATAERYGVGLATVGLFTTALFVTHTAIQVPGGRATDRLGARRTAIASLLAIVLANGLACLAAEPVLAILARALTGAGTGLAFIAGSSLVRASGGSPFAQGLFGGIGLGGGGLALALVPAAEGAAGWRAPYLTAIAIAGVALALTLVVPRARPARAADGAGRSARGVFGDRGLYRLALLYSCSYGVTVVLANWVVELLQRHGSMGDGAASVVGALVLLLGVVTRPLGGWALRTRPERIRAVVAVSLVAGAAGTAALVVARPTALAVAGGLLVGVGAGLSFAPVFTGAAGLRADAPAAAIGFVNGVANFVVLVGTPLLGLAFALPGEGRAGFLVIVPLWLLALAGLPGRRALGAAPG